MLISMLRLIVFSFLLMPLPAMAAVDAGRFSLASLEQPKFEYKPAEPLWEENPIPYVPYDYKDGITERRSPLRVQGSALRAPSDRKSTSLSAQDSMGRVTEQRMLQSYGSSGWEQMAVDGQLRLHEARSADGLSPYVTGGMGVTQLSGANQSLDPNARGALGLRYGAGVAYSVGDEFDFTAGYRVNRMDESARVMGPNERLNVQMLDFGLRYKY